MFDAGYEGSGCVNSEPNGDKPSRRQYTLKGVEAETIQLMRDAAGREGMKIGSWISLRMREAAEKALSPISGGAAEPTKPPVSGAQDETVNQLCLIINAQREEAEARFLKLERELHEITSVQRSILTQMLVTKG